MNLLRKLQHSFDFWFLLITSFIFFLTRLPSFFEPYWYGDEGVYEVLGFGMRHGRLLYQGIWDNKPPLLYLIYGLFDGNQMYVRFFSFVVGLVAVYFFFALSKRLFQEKKSVYFATGFFTLFLGLPFLEGNIANAENFMILPIVAALYLVIRTLQEKKVGLLSLFFAGLLLGISFLIKVVAVFDFATAFLLITFITLAWNKKSLIQLFAQHASLAAGFFLPFLATLGFFAYKGILKVFIQSAFLSNVGYVGFGNQFMLPFTHTVIPQGFLLLKFFFVLLVTLFVFFKRKSLSLLQLLLYTWLPFSLFNAFFSQRPYTHYVLTLLGGLALLVGIFFEKKFVRLYILLFVALLILLAKNFWFYANTPFYYANFAQFLFGQKTISSYQSFFDKGVPRDYAVADFLLKNLGNNEQVFIWTNSAQIYYLVHKLPLGRYAVAYHMLANEASLEETALDLKKAKPRFLVILPNAPIFPFRITDYRLRIAIQDGLIYERIF